MLECVTCHDPHTGVRYNDQEGAAAIRVGCDDCHSRARESIMTNALAAQKGSFDCEACHMPYEGKSAVAFDTYVGDVRTHIFAINADETAEPFTDDGAFANPYVTLEFACLGCHMDEDKAWAALNAPDVHGSDFVALRSPASASKPR